MRIRPFTEADLPALVELTVETFRPLFEEQIRPAYGEELFALHHGRWQQDYRDEIPALHDPAAARWIAVAEVDAAPVGFVAWSVATARPDHGRIQLLAVSQQHRRGDIGRRLCRHAIEALKAGGRGRRARHRRRGPVPRPRPSALREHRLPQGPDRRLHHEDLTTGPAGECRPSRTYIRSLALGLSLASSVRHCHRITSPDLACPRATLRGRGLHRRGVPRVRPE